MSGKIIETSRPIVPLSRQALHGALAVLGLCILRPAVASAQLIESFENTLDGWTFNPTYNTQPYTASFSNTTGVTDGNYSLQISGTTDASAAKPLDFSVMLVSPFSVNMTDKLADGFGITMDVFLPYESFGYGIQIDVDLYDGSGPLGFQSLDGFTYPYPVLGTETTMYYPETFAQHDALEEDASNDNPVAMYIQIGSGLTPGNQTFWLDNIRTGEIPEPASLSLLAVGASFLSMRRPKVRA